MGLFANPDLGGWLSNVGSDFGNSFSDLAGGVQNLGSSLGLGGAPQADPISTLQGFYALGQNTPTSLQDWYSQAAQLMPGMTGAVTPNFSAGLAALGGALAPSTPASPMTMPASGAGVSALGQTSSSAGSAASGASSAAQSAQALLGAGSSATAPRFAAPVLARPAGLQFGAGFGGVALP